VSIDYAAQKVERWSLETGAGPKPSILGGEIDVVVEEPLRLELADFADAIACRRAPRVAGQAGRRALALAQEIADRMAAV
jgi:hypothetical protein